MATRKTGAKLNGFNAVVKAFATDRDVTPPGEGKGFGSHKPWTRRSALG